jgi:hypothetical protein
MKHARGSWGLAASGLGIVYLFFTIRIVSFLVQNRSRRRPRRRGRRLERLMAKIAHGGVPAAEDGGWSG